MQVYFTNMQVEEKLNLENTKLSRCLHNSGGACGLIHMHPVCTPVHSLKLF